MNLFTRFSRWLSYNPPTALSMDGWELFYKEFKREAPVRYFLRSIRLKRSALSKRIHRAYISVGYRFVRQYHVLETGLKPGYRDLDERLLHGCFSEFSRFIEDEYIYQFFRFKRTWRRWVPFINPHCPSERKNRAVELSSKALDDEILSLYHWWNCERPAQLKDTPYPDLQAKDTEMLIKLIKVRQDLWC